PETRRRGRPVAGPEERRGSEFGWPPPSSDRKRTTRRPLGWTARAGSESPWDRLRGPADRSARPPDTAAPAAWPPCRTLLRRHHRGLSRATDTGRTQAHRRGWCGLPRPRARETAATGPISPARSPAGAPRGG